MKISIQYSTFKLRHNQIGLWDAKDIKNWYVKKFLLISASNPSCYVQTCDQTITGRNLKYKQALDIVQSEEYLMATDFDEIYKYKIKRWGKFQGYRNRYIKLIMDISKGLCVLKQGPSHCFFTIMKTQKKGQILILLSRLARDS